MNAHGGFVPDGFEVPERFEGEGFRLEPLGVQHNESDHRAWMSSIDHIRSSPGFPDGRWPREMTLEENADDLRRHAVDFAGRRGFTYTVLEGDGDEVVGCVYIYPAEDAQVDAHVSSWVRADRADLDLPLRRVVSAWLERDWPFTSFHYDGVA